MIHVQKTKVCLNQKWVYGRLMTTMAINVILCCWTLCFYCTVYLVCTRGSRRLSSWRYYDMLWLVSAAICIEESKDWRGVTISRPKWIIGLPLTCLAFLTLLCTFAFYLNLSRAYHPSYANNLWRHKILIFRAWCSAAEDSAWQYSFCCGRLLA